MSQSIVPSAIGILAPLSSRYFSLRIFVQLSSETQLVSTPA
jgi:hypothetical protein